MKLEKDPESVGIIDEMFRLIHTLKGNAAAIGYEEVSGLAHKTEDVFLSLRHQQRRVTPTTADVLYKSFDLLGELLDVLETQQKDLPDLTPLLQELEGLSEHSNAIADPALIYARDTATVELADTVRIATEKLDKLMNLVGELVIDGSRIVSLHTETEDVNTKEVLSHFQRILIELHNSVMGLRMVPIRSLFLKFPRVVRDLARQQEKEIDLVIEGEETEIDRTLLEKLNDPILHLVRNAVGHGVETRDERPRSGKNLVAKIRLSATREQQKIVIEVSDDGRGIDLQQVRHAAIEQKVAHAEALENKPDEEILILLTQPGFSLAKTTTNISGRGIGMDVVKQGVDSIGGELLIRSTFGKGTTIRIEMPPSIMVIKALLLKLAFETYALPLSNISRIVSISQEQVHRVGESFVVSLADKTIPVVFLREILIPRPRAAFQRPAQPHQLNLILISAGERTIGFIVDDLENIQEIVIKPLQQPVDQLEFFSGVTVLGNGRPCLILDVPGIVKSVIAQAA